jgi:hypothetical protein
MQRSLATGLVFALTSAFVATGFACGGGDSNANATSTGGGATTAGGNSASGGNSGSGGADEGDGFKSGTRLKQKWFDFGGAKTPAGIFDKKRNEDCAPTTWSDNKVYCTPKTGAVVFKDASCSNAIGKAPLSDCAVDLPPYFADTEQVHCDSRPRRIYPRGPKLETTPSTEYYRDQDGHCTGPTTPEAGDYYQVGAVVNAADLVEITTAVEKGAGRYARQVLESSDGFRSPISGAMDTTLGASCSFVAPTGGKSGTCRPDAAGFAQLFDDAACSKPVLDATNLCVSPVVALTGDGDNCPFRNVTVWKLGGAIDGDILYQGGGSAACEMTLGTPDGKFIATDGKLDLPEVARAAETLGGRPVESIHYSEGSTRFLDGALYDLKLALECQATLGDDGATRCVPDLARTELYFTSSDCDEASAIEIAVVAIDGANCKQKSQRSPYAVVTSSSNECAVTRTIHRLGSAYDKPLYQRNLDCKLAPAAKDLAYYALGPAVPASEFVVGKPVTDP